VCVCVCVCVCVRVCVCVCLSVCVLVYTHVLVYIRIIQPYANIRLRADRMCGNVWTWCVDTDTRSAHRYAIGIRIYLIVYTYTGLLCTFVGQGLGRLTATPRRSVWAYETHSPRYQAHCQNVTGFVSAPP
jgi:hypothetical protein